MTAKQKITIMLQLDVSGDICPLSLLKTKRWLKQQQNGQLVELIVKDSQDSKDIWRYLQQTKQDVLEVKSAHGQIFYQLRVVRT